MASQTSVLAALNLDTIRTFLHLLGVAGWIGGQILMLGLLGVLRGLGSDAPRLAADRFSRVAWPCFALAVVTGVWGWPRSGSPTAPTVTWPPC